MSKEVKHIIRYGGDFTAWGLDDSFRTFCGLTENNKITAAPSFVESNCIRCLSSFNKSIKDQENELCKLKI